MIFNIQKFCVNDGPGIRTTVFFKGCPLNCIWCHNPESKSTNKEIFFDLSKCTFCGKCEKICPAGCHKIKDNMHIFERKDCILCNKCIEACNFEALSSVGYKISVDEIIKEVTKDEIFYKKSGGGLTLSGGEPLYQFDFALDILKAAKEKGIHTCIETCGFTSETDIKKIAPFVDIFLYDYKETNSEKHKKYTGQSNDIILKNLFTLDSMNKQIILRCPIIPGYNDNESHLKGIGETANRLRNLLRIEIEPYHSLGKSKSEYLNKEYLIYNIPSMDNQTVDDLIKKIQKYTDKEIRRG